MSIDPLLLIKYINALKNIFSQFILLRNQKKTLHSTPKQQKDRITEDIVITIYVVVMSVLEAILSVIPLIG